ncbi:maltotransferase domain-containing protein, partial [Streptomyces sp. NPDC002742]|uniref:maltotransferase domain-containing protein n=1 Tax=Streptomyces sp. NPDC002742 TaxID=3364663 RepID=UPI0036CDC8D1
MPATHHTSPPPTTTPETPRTRKAEAGPRTPEKPSAAPGGHSPATPGPADSTARSTTAASTAPGTDTPVAGTSVTGTSVSGTSATGKPAAGASVGVTSATGKPAAGASVAVTYTPDASAPDTSTPVTSAPDASAPRSAAPKSKRAGSRPGGAKAAPTTAKSAPKTGKAAAKTGKAVPKAGKTAPGVVKAAARAGKAAVPATRTPDAPDAPVAPAAAPATAVGRIPVLDVRPVVQHGRRPAKAVVGEEFEVSATVFREGHDAVAANVVLRDPDGRPGPWTPMRELAPGTDRWGAGVSAGTEGHWTYTVEAWGDPVTTWRHHAGIKIPAGLDTELVLEEGALLYERAVAELPKGPKGRSRRDTLIGAVDALRDTGRPVASRLAAALTPEVDEVLARHPLRDLVTSSEPLPLLVERERALFGSWYEFFPRSESGRSGRSGPAVHGTFRTAAERLPAIAEMGFDVVYLPP